MDCFFYFYIIKTVVNLLFQQILLIKHQNMKNNLANKQICLIKTNSFLVIPPSFRVLNKNNGAK